MTSWTGRRKSGETSSAGMSPADAVPPMLAVAREEYGRIAYTHKTHEKMVERLSRQVRFQRIANAVLLTATAGSTIDVLVRNETISKYVSLILSALALFLAIYQL